MLDHSCTIMPTKIYSIDPFVSIDPKGVGTLVEMGVERGRKAALI